MCLDASLAFFLWQAREGWRVQLFDHDLGSGHFFMVLILKTNLKGRLASEEEAPLPVRYRIAVVMSQSLHSITEMLGEAEERMQQVRAVSALGMAQPSCFSPLFLA